MSWRRYWAAKEMEKEGLLPPWGVEKQLNITSTERRKWQNKGYLKVEKFVEIYYKGRYVNVPYFSPEVLNISPETIKSWRKQDLEEKKQKLKAAREQATKKVRETVNKRKEILRELEEEAEKLPIYSGMILKAAFWARLASRWAKKQQIKDSMKRTTEPEEMYEIKDNIIKKIWQLREEIKNEETEIELKFYTPEEPHRYSVVFCPVGKKYFPSYQDLEKIDEIENEYGIFRFGAPVTEDEERLFPIKLVKKESEKIIDELQQLIQQINQEVVISQDK